MTKQDQIRKAINDLKKIHAIIDSMYDESKRDQFYDRQAFFDCTDSIRNMEQGICKAINQGESAIELLNEWHTGAV